MFVIDCSLTFYMIECMMAADDFKIINEDTEVL